MEDPIQTNRGLPPDLKVEEREQEYLGFRSVITDYYYETEFVEEEYAEDGKLWLGEHNYGWVTFDEILERTTSFCDEFGDSHFIDWVFSILEADKADFNDLPEMQRYRFVFGFDS